MSGRERGLLRRHGEFRWFWGGQTISVFAPRTGVAIGAVAAVVLKGAA